MRGSKLQKKIDQYNISMKKGIKRYTPVNYPVNSTIEVKHLHSPELPGTARHLCSSTNSKGSIGESSIATKYWSGSHPRHGPSKFHKTITEEGTRETS